MGRCRLRCDRRFGSQRRLRCRHRRRRAFAGGKERHGAAQQGQPECHAQRGGQASHAARTFRTWLCHESARHRIRASCSVPASMCRPVWRWAAQSIGHRRRLALSLHYRRLRLYGQMSHSAPPHPARDTPTLTPRAPAAKVVNGTNVLSGLALRRRPSAASPPFRGGGVALPLTVLGGRAERARRIAFGSSARSAPEQTSFPGASADGTRAPSA